ncbi:TIGR04222 domain-containing membrane protein [Synechococcus sp. CS-1332]|uniref:TIGR04222 domain-containing membrane protein n=1 Tax=Synechococcus sp. CS-1332 TaxID=2847972 RepID=UPI00223B00A6|nr:TIGR04222 domain-containing membrane protein [Synechococcus sp. CS-1332]MCT0206554.1 TIGR04222 domain-containing membrane protein [Synechococcus sp. CS-1332]
MLDSQRDIYRRIQAYELDGPSHQIGFVRHLMRQQGWSREHCLRAIEEYKKFVFLASVAGHQAVPSDAVDQVWHLHLLYSESYWEDFCPNVLGRRLQHCPAQGGWQERERFHHLYRATIDSYRQSFGEPPLDLWPPADIRFGRDVQMQRLHIGRRLSARIRLGSPLWRRPGLRQLLTLLSLLLGCAIASTPLARATSSTSSATSATADLQAMLLLLLAMAVGLVIRRLIRRPDAQATIPLLSAEQLAYLARGATGALDVALVQLVDRGVLRPDQHSTKLVLTSSASPSSSPLEQQLVHRLTQLAHMPTYENLIALSAYNYSTLKNSLREKRLIIGPLSLALSRSFYLLLIPLIMCYMTSASHPVSHEFRHAFASVLLGPWTLALVGSVFLIIPGGRTRWGSSVLLHHQEHGDAHDPMMRVALRGLTALSGGRLDDLRLLIQRRKRELEQSCCGC